VPFDPTWIFNLCINKKFGIRGIFAEIYPDDSYSFNIQTCYSTKQDSSYYIYNKEINTNLRTQRMTKRGQTIVDRMKSENTFQVISLWAFIRRIPTDTAIFKSQCLVILSFFTWWMTGIMITAFYLMGI
jgi:hypothetical protein